MQTVIAREPSSGYGRDAPAAGVWVRHEVMNAIRFSCRKALPKGSGVGGKGKEDHASPYWISDLIRLSSDAIFGSQVQSSQRYSSPHNAVGITADVMAG